MSSDSNSAFIDTAFKAIPKNSSYFNIWRIERMKLVAVPRDQWGNFYTGDSYLLLSIKEAKCSLVTDIHFWLGSETSDDEAGVAAIKAVELDDFLGGLPTQHRDVQGHESPLFLAYFKPKGGVRYMQGGVSSGLSHVENVVEEKLLHVKGKRNVRVTEVPINWSSFNSGDAFILDLGSTVFLWQGSSCSPAEKYSAAVVSKNISEERTNQMNKRVPVIVIQDGLEDHMKGDEKELWERHLPLSQRTVKSADAGGDDRKSERTSLENLKLYQVSDATGAVKITEKSSGPLSQSDLKSEDSFIVDDGGHGIWVWIGKGATKKERTEAMRNGVIFIKKKGYSGSTPVNRVIDGGEPAEFRALFKAWRTKDAQVGLGKVFTQNKIAQTVQTSFDAASMHEHPKMAASSGMVDDGSGRIGIWRIENFDLVPLEKKYFGTFFGGDCYVILYTYRASGSERFIIYYWLGARSTPDEQGTAALKAIEVDDQLGGAAVQVRVIQGKEPPHFMAMFDGKMIVFQGGKAGWNQGAADEGPGDSYLLQVRGTSRLICKAVQVAKRAASLNSNDCFVLFSKSNVYVWCGKGCTGDEREMAKMVGKLAPREPVMLFEGQEKPEFWNCLGGKEAYSNDKRLQEAENEIPTRLFQASNASGTFRVEEIIDFEQRDLVEDDVMILDAGNNVYIWVGSSARPEEKKQAEKAAVDYLNTDPTGRDVGTPIICVKQGYEPPTFTGHFGVWDRDLWSNGLSYADLISKLGETTIGVDVLSTSEVDGGVVRLSKFPLEVLQRPAKELPPSVNQAQREIHLSESDFRKHFDATYAEFTAMPVWKQQMLKKKLKLF